MCVTVGVSDAAPAPASAAPHLHGYHELVEQDRVHHPDEADARHKVEAGNRSLLPTRGRAMLWAQPSPVQTWGAPIVKLLLAALFVFAKQAAVALLCIMARLKI